MSVKQKIPAFCRGTEEALLAAISEGGRFYPVSRIIWCWIKSGERAGQLAFVTPGLNEGDDPIVEYMVGDNTDQVQVVEELPSISDAVEGVLYIVGDEGYTFNGTAYTRVFKNVDIESLTEQVDALEATVSGFDERITTAETTVASYGENIDALNDEINTIDNALFAHETRIADAETDIASLKSDMTTAQDDITTLNNNLYSLSNTVTAQGQDITALQQQVGLMQNNITDIETRVSGLESTTSNMQTDIFNAQSDISGLQTSTTSMQSDISDIQDSIDMSFVF